ncbi:MAG: amidohydrolase family protein [Pseudomonadota bacterium]|nr:amidohydrolase [Gammaproteobacteria bacterium]MBJ56174.1 amidohydrolase [Gammaproteobacteria bacterium]MEC8859159.1 amidohydrolase family protein [Pseudomonadota bacterium]HBN13866.1 amidohydrolase [Pseudohongiella sp.]|tara:strand:+ start:283 stop:1590 length:1308 start_codon:yes stop_codon:yes gene_type:complete
MKIINRVVRVVPVVLAVSMLQAIVPRPAPDQSEPIAITGAVIHVGDGTVIEDGVLAFDQGVITYVGTDANSPAFFNHQVIDVEGRHIYPGFILPNTSLGLSEVSNIRATNDVVETGDINASVRSAIAYNTDSELIPTFRFNGILTAQITPQGGLVSGSSSVMKLDGWNWEDTLLSADGAMHMHWPARTQRQRNEISGQFETVDNEDYANQVQVLHALFQDAITYTGSPVNLNLAAMQNVLSGEAKLFIHANDARDIVNSVQFARDYEVPQIVIVGGRDAMKVKDLLLQESVAVIYESVHGLPAQSWYDVDEPFKVPFQLHDAGILVGIGGGETALDSQRNLPFFAGTAASYGLDRETALAMITEHNARILDVDDRVGTLVVGKDATFFIAAGDALDMRTNQLDEAFIQGRLLELQGMQQELYERFYERYAGQPIE